MAAGICVGGSAAPIPAAALSMERAKPKETASTGDSSLFWSLSALSAWSQQEWSKSFVIPNRSRMTKLMSQVCLGVRRPVRRLPASREKERIRLEIEVRTQREERGIFVRLTP